MRQNMKRTWLGFIVEFLEEHFFLNEFFDPGQDHSNCPCRVWVGFSLKLLDIHKYAIYLDKLPGNRFYNDFADLVDKRAQIIFPGEQSAIQYRLYSTAE